MAQITSANAAQMSAKAGAKRGAAKITPETLLRRSMITLAQAIRGAKVSNTQLNAAKSVLSVLYEAGVKPNYADDTLSESIKALLSTPESPTVTVKDTRSTTSDIVPEASPIEAPKKDGGS